MIYLTATFRNSQQLLGHNRDVKKLMKAQLQSQKLSNEAGRARAVVWRAFSETLYVRGYGACALAFLPDQEVEGFFPSCATE